MDNERIAKQLLKLAKEVVADKNEHNIRTRHAYSLNAAKVPLKKARKYAEEEFEDNRQELDEVLPDFDKNYKLLQNKLKKAIDVPRVQMPVIEPSDIKLFKKRLEEGAIDIFQPYARGKVWMPDGFSGDEAEEWITLGFEDGEPNDDSIKGKLGGVQVGKLLPTQSQIWFDKLIKNIIKFGPPSSGSPVLSTTIIVSSDKYILDGHHRFGQAILADPSLKMQALYVPLPIDKLLAIGKAYGEAIGNKPKASIRKRRSGRTKFRR